ncbi:hypothetical protein LXA43DRAFT_416344 [Ganoderma leucocontextum]|nr:hypothetical protein LXA43DRAFT_416344 [Ganoderma leucocontextum]
MPPRPRDPPAAPGLLASAFSFVSRELESFVTAATGGDLQHKTQTQPEASSSRVTLDGKRRAREDGREGRSERERERERERKAKRVRKRSEVEDERARAKRRLREEDEDERASSAAKKRAQVVQERERSSEREAADDEDEELPVRPLPKTSKKRRDAAPKNVEHDVVEDVDGPEPQPQSRERGKKSCKRTFPNPSELMPPPPPPKSMPPPPTPLTTRNSSLPFPTMPGSFFERSTSLMPELTPTPYKRAVPRPRTPSPPSVIEEEPEEEEQVDDQPIESTSNPSPRRGRSESLGGEKSVATDRAGPSQERESSGRGVSGRPSSKSRRSIEEPDADPSDPIPRLASRKGKERAWDTSGEIRVRGKEEELREAMEDHARNAHERGDREREQDKRRIRMLEEEVARLRVELALKNSASVAAMMPPPPPPPPPPPLMRVHEQTTSADKTETFLASARASLKHTAPPVEAPINAVAYGGARTRKAGQPTVNVPSDKMAAFLREMKSVRLRRVGGPTGSMGPPLFPSSAAGDIAGEARASEVSEARRAAVLGDTSFDTGVAARIFIGEKRKRDTVEEITAGPSKRRVTTFIRSDVTGASASSSSQSSQSSQSSSQSSTSQSSAPSSQSSVPSSQSTAPSSRSSASQSSLFDAVPSTSRSHTSRSKLTAPLRIWPTHASETDITTPSLCSDNENDQSGHSEDKLPDTPSDSGRGRRVDTVLPREPLPQRSEEPEIIDVDALDTPPNVKAKGKAKAKPKPKRPPTPHPRGPEPKEESDVDVEPQAATDPARMNAFARRIPESPLPSRSPAKPKPPARVKTTKTSAPSKLPLPRRVPNPNFVPPPSAADRGSDSDDPLLMARLRPEGMGGSLFDEEMPGPVAGPSRVSGSREKGASSTSTSASASGHGRSRSLSYTLTHAQAQAQAQAPAANGERPASRMSNHAKRRLTLDEELRRAGDSLWRGSSEEPQQPPSEPEEDLDSGQLVAQGTRSSRSGFLARGGGAGPPVFMGEGYVQGVVTDEGEERLRPRTTSTGGSRRRG